MSKESTSLFECSACGAQYTKWSGRCLECGKWGSVEKSKFQISNPNGSLRDVKSMSNDKVQQYEMISSISLSEVKSAETARIKTNIGELDRVLGGGLVPGSLILLGGEPGIGKSTLALQLAAIVPNTLYVSGEESTQQIKMRADRLTVKSNTLRLANASTVENIIATIINNKTSSLIIIDSIQTIHSDEVEGEAGNINQVRACTVKLMETAKSTGATIVLIGQVTKEGTVAGPKTLEHLVDTVIYLEGDRFHQFRILRAAKNRFGSTDEVGVFSMEENGLQEVKNPSALFLSGRGEPAPGSAVTCLIEGTRPMLVEIQALVTKTNFGYPQRRAAGFDLNRLQVLIAVLSKRTGLPLDSYDVFLNVVGGLHADEPAADLAVILAIASATKNKQLPKGLIAFGEVGLGGEVRGVNKIKKRLEEAKQMGFVYAAIPHSDKPEKISNLKVAMIKNVKEVVEQIVS